MSTTLRDFIASREAEIRESMKLLKAELAELKVARAALDAASPAQAEGGEGQTVTIKDMIRKVLSEGRQGMTSEEILAEVFEVFGRSLERTSLSPQLSRLKDNDEVVLQGKKWFLKELHHAWQERLIEQSSFAVAYEHENSIENARLEELLG